MITDPLIGRQLANFRLERLLGRGGMAHVYYGHDVILDRPVAVKVIDARLRDEQVYAQRFLQEARTVAQWRHENIVQVYYATAEEGLLYFVMEFIDGQDVGQLLAGYRAAGRLMPTAEVLRIGRAVAAALDFAHERGVIHRDVKPGNVMVARDGRVALADFGLALDVEQGSLGETFGSARYVAPEQARRSSAAVPQSDLYSLGVMLYEMLAGQVPFDDPSPTSLALQHVMRPPPPPRSINPDLRPATEAVLLKALAKQPEARYQHGRELMDALAGSFTPAAADTGPLAVPPIRPRPGRAFWLLLLGLVLVAATAAGVALALVANARAGEGQGATRTVAPAATGPAAGGAPTTAADAAPAAGTAAANQLLLPVAPAALPTATSAPPLVITAVRPLQLYYDPASFYVLNLGASPLGIKPIAFEALDADGQPAAYRFDGSMWSQFYFFLESGGCDRIEITRAAPYLRPGQCRRYNATVTPQQDDPMVFWIARPGVTLFRVLWDGQEVGRCPIDGGFCEVYLPL